MSQSISNAPSYSKRRIGSLPALSAALQCPVADLLALATRASKLYRVARSVTKSDGTVRYTYDALPTLKAIHRKIKSQILDHVVYPPYLTGSVKGCDYRANASLHVGARIVISEDISGFFPSTSADHVYLIWRDFFGFDKDVAQCLALLTTRNGELPQGAIPSSFLANLVFWRDEPELHATFSAQGLAYTRYVDDIAVSAKEFLSDGEKADVVRQLYGLLFRRGYRPKRIKHDIATSGKRMVVTKLAVNAKPGLAPATRSRVRAEVHALEKRVEFGENLCFESGVYTQVMGKVLHLERFHPGKAAPLKKRLLALKRAV